MADDRAEDMLMFLRNMMLDEGTVIIQPHKEPFRPLERSFLDGIRKCPAAITAPPGVNPYSAALGRPGRWVFLWIPEK